MEECSYSKVTGCFSRFLNCTNVTNRAKHHNDRED